MRSNFKNPKGFSLAEAMIATVILGVAACGILLPFTCGASARAEGVRQTLAAKLAGDFVEQIINTPFAQIVDSFDGYSEAQGQVKDAGGTVFTGSNYAAFSRTVSCAYVYMPQESGSEEPKFILTAVRVSYNGGEIAIINRLIGK